MTVPFYLHPTFIPPIIFISGDFYLFVPVMPAIACGANNTLATPTVKEIAMILFAKHQLSVSVTNALAFCQILFDASASPADAEATMLDLQSKGIIDKSFKPTAGLTVTPVPTRDGRTWMKSVINMRSDSPALVARLREDATIRKMDALDTQRAEPSADNGPAF